MVERALCMREARGSIPLFSTYVGFFFLGAKQWVSAAVHTSGV